MPPVVHTELKKRLLAKMTIVGDCWEFNGEILRNGYGRLTATLAGNRMRFSAHRLSYMLFVGPIPDNLVIDHLCRNRRCFNPKHLEAVTILENVRRSLPFKPKKIGNRYEYCQRGHMDWIIGYNGFRTCHTCRMEREKLRQRKIRLERKMA